MNPGAESPMPGRFLKFSGLNPISSMLVCLHAGMPLCWHAALLVCHHAGMPPCWYASVLVCLRAGRPPCWYAATVRFSWSKCGQMLFKRFLGDQLHLLCEAASGRFRSGGPVSDWLPLVSDWARAVSDWTLLVVSNAGDRVSDWAFRGFGLGLGGFRIQALGFRI